jgi:hypothetical protein
MTSTARSRREAAGRIIWDYYARERDSHELSLVSRPRALRQVLGAYYQRNVIDVSS